MLWALKREDDHLGERSPGQQQSESNQRPSGCARR
jgi:hypothetical protein